jgi:hypothetical protein
MRSGDTTYDTGEWESLHLDRAWKYPDDYETGPQTQSEYPMWYFLTGAIAQPLKMKALWKLDELPYARWANVYGLQTFGDDWYQGLRPCSEFDEDMDDNDVGALGVAYLVNNKLQEDRLRLYKTLLFEVKQCKIILHALTEHGAEQTVDAMTFVLCDEADESEEEAESPESLGSDSADAALLEESPPLTPRRPRFPILRCVGRPAHPANFNARLRLLRSSSRPRSSLMHIINAENLITPPISPPRSPSRSPPRSPPRSPDDEEELEKETESDDCMDTIHGRPPPYPRIVFEEMGPWWDLKSGYTKSGETVDTEPDHETTTFQSEGIWMVSGTGASVDLNSPSVQSITPDVSERSLPIRERLSEVKEPPPEPSGPTVTVEEVLAASDRMDDTENDSQETTMWEEESVRHTVAVQESSGILTEGENIAAQEEERRRSTSLNE